MSTMEGRAAARAQAISVRGESPPAAGGRDPETRQATLAMPSQSDAPAAPRVGLAAPARSQPKPGADSLNVLQTADVLAEGARPLEMLLDPLLPAGSVMLAHGPAGAGLTHFLIG